LGCHSVRGFFERDFQVVAKIGAALCGTATRAAAPTTKYIAKTKQVAEDVFDSTKTGRAPRPCAGRAARNACVTKAVVTLALLGIGEDAVSFGCFLELLFRAGVVWIFIRVLFYCEKPVGALNFLLRRGAADG
jgi:hypothetical protein